MDVPMEILLGICRKAAAEHPEEFPVLAKLLGLPAPAVQQQPPPVYTQPAI